MKFELLLEVLNKILDFLRSFIKTQKIKNEEKKYEKIHENPDSEFAKHFGSKLYDDANSTNRDDASKT